MSSNSERIKEQLRKIYLKAEQDIIEAIFYKRRRGLLDYSEQAALRRVQRILTNMQDACWKYVPKMIEANFYVSHPELAKMQDPVQKHIGAYLNAEMTAEQTDVAQSLASNLMAEVIRASNTVEINAQQTIGRITRDDVYRRAALEANAQMESEGNGVWKTSKSMAKALAEQGVRAFTDKSGREWSLYSYCNMATRTADRQAATVAVLTADPGQDLYKITSHAASCPLCAPLEGRVYSKSGKDPDYPPLSEAFGKIDPSGPESLANSYLNIHPNCMHSLVPYTTVGRSNKEVQEDKDFSNFKKNPPDFNPQPKKDIDSYRRQQDARREFLSMLRQFEQYRAVLGDKMPKTAQTFIKHKMDNDKKYQNWVNLFKEATKE